MCNTNTNSTDEQIIPIILFVLLERALQSIYEIRHLGQGKME